MTDKELLELAARAAGYTVARWSDDGDALLLEGVQEPWSSLASDADAFRLAVKLRIAVYYQAPDFRRNWTAAARTFDGAFCSESGDDPYAATRRAITRAAAAIAQERGDE